ncbi:MAG: hypothetical protein MUE70_13540, partial [Desulfobacterales bacterium]|nr:hypothetical protein [Desulfobacterales bacterium]
DVRQTALQEATPHAVDVEIPFKAARSMVEKRFEKAYLREALKRFGGNVSETARMTGINPRTIWRKIKEYEIEKDRSTNQPEV